MSNLVHKHSRDTLVAWGAFFGIVLLIRLFVPYIEEHKVGRYLPTPPPAIQKMEREVEGDLPKNEEPTPRSTTSLA